MTPSTEARPKLLPPVSTTPCTSSLAPSGSIPCVVNVPGAPPLTQIPPTAAPSTSTTVTPVSASASVTWPTLTPGTSVMASRMSVCSYDLLVLVTGTLLLPGYRHRRRHG